MTMQIIRIALAGLLLLAATSVPAQETRPNFIFILTDDHGWSQISTPMDPDIPGAASSYFETPNMERLANQGMRFASGYSPAPLCTPTRRSILCGMTPARQRGTEFASEFDWTGRLTIPKALRQVDPAYRSAHFGKFGSKMGTTPEEAGFDESDGSTTNMTGGMPIPMEERGQTVAKEDPKLAFSLTARATAFMERQVREGHPFYLQISHYATHLQVQTRPDSLAKYRRKGQPDRAVTHGFAGMLEDLDTAAGEVIDAVERLGIGARTYIFFMADNGGRDTIPGADNSLPPPNRPLNGAKHSLYEGGIRVPFIVTGPGVAANTVSRVPVTGYDLLPTLFDLAGGRGPLPAEIDGGSFRDVLENRGAGEVNRGFAGLVFHRPRWRRGPQSAIRVGNHKLLINWATAKRARETLLFDLESDVEEKRDLSAKAPARTAELMRLLVGYLETVSAAMPDKP